jgi:hypothetical protein
MAVFAQQRPWKAQSLSRADPSSLASEASDPRSGLGLYGEHGSGTRLGRARMAPRAQCFDNWRVVERRWPPKPDADGCSSFA